MSKSKIIFGLLLVIIGMLILGNNLELFYVSVEDFFRVAAPLGLILLGLWLIVRRHRVEGRRGGERVSVHVHTGSSEYTTYTEDAASGTAQETPEPPPKADATVNGTGRARYSKTFGDMYITCEGVNLQNMEVSSFIGDIEINLAGGILQPGLNRMVVSGFIGDLRIIVPRDMEVMAHVSVFGGDVDVLGRRVSGFGNNIDGQTPDYQAAEKKLFIAVNTFLGDMKVIRA
jgi:lia operon protein LiaF